MPADQRLNEDQPLDRRAVREAAHWLMRLGAAEVTDADIDACNQWRASHVEHERAWQRAQTLSKAFGLIPQDVGMATLGRPPSPTRRTAFKTLAVLLMASPVAWASWNSAPAVRWRSDYQTAAGVQREWVLEDGSRLWLNTASAINQHLSDTAHTLWLREGEMYVEAAAKGQPPLQIQTHLGNIHAEASSRLSVRLDAQRCFVHVLAGHINIQPAATTIGAIRLSATEHTSFDLKGVSPRQTNAIDTPEWLRGTLCADAMRLDDFVAELSRYRPGIIRCEPSIAALQLSGTFQLDNTDGVLRALPTLLPVQVDYRTAYWVTLRPTSKQA
jgi:transmembrane sensor